MTTKLNSILFIDDDSMSNLNSKRIIEKTNLAEEVLFTGSAREALDLLEKKFLLSGKFPALIFLDIYMSPLDGWWVLEQLKTMPWLEHNTKIIMLSSSDDDADRERAMKNPEVSGYLVKPLTEEYLLELTQNMPGHN